MSLIPRLCSTTTTATGRRYCLHAPKFSQQQARASTLSSVTIDSQLSRSPLLVVPLVSQQWMGASTHSRFRSLNLPRQQYFSSDTTTSARSRFRDIPVHPSILEYIRRIGVGRQGKEARRKRHPYGKKKRTRDRNNTGGGDGGDFNTIMSREEERLFLGKGRVARRSGIGSSSSQSGGDRQRISPVVPPSPPPPFGNGKNVRKVPLGDSDEGTGTTTNNNNTRNIRVLPVKVLGRVTPPSSPIDDNDGRTDIFPRPSSGLPEVAIVGRSNVGKSTLLNALLYSGRSIEKKESEAAIRKRNKRLRSNVVTSQTAKLPRGAKAKTSSKPGETRSIDFYQLSAEIVEEPRPQEVNNKNKNNDGVAKRKKKSSLLLVDLPGYGFAFGPKKERRQLEYDEGDGKLSSVDFLFPWQSLIETYITNRPRSSLKRILLLIDARHGMKQADSQFLEALQRALTKKQKRAIQTFAEEQKQQQQQQQQPRVPTELPPLQIVLTKCDLVSQVDLARRVVQVREQLSDCLVRQPKILPEMLVSAQIEGQGGVLELQKELASLCGGGGDFQ